MLFELFKNYIFIFDSQLVKIFMFIIYEYKTFSLPIKEEWC